MKNIVLRNSILSVILLVVTGYINFLISKEVDYNIQEIGGYISIIISMLFVFIGIRQYRADHGGIITYGRALKVGVLITILPSIAFGIFDIIYVKYLDPGFLDKYYTYAQQHAKASMSPEQFQAYARQMEQEKAMFGNLYFQFFVMAMTVFIVGVIVAAISALILQKKQRAVPVS